MLYRDGVPIAALSSTGTLVYQDGNQQATLVRGMIEDLNFPIEIAVSATVRESDGLALSSRNAYLGPDDRAAAVVLSRIDKRNVIQDPTIDVGRLGGRYEEAESGGVVAYRLKRPVLAFATSFLAGIVSNFGIGGGIVKVPVLNAWCGVPIRTAAATSSMMIGATALVLTIQNYQAGHIVPPLAAAAVLGVLLGTQAGVYVQQRSKAKTHKMVMVALLLTVAALYLFRIGR